MAVAILEGAGRLTQAADALADFRQIYPGSPLAAGVDMRLADLYEKTENLPAAAQEYVRLARNAEDSEVRRQSLFRAAEIYLEIDARPLAMEHFRDYALTYEKPRDLRLEAVHHLDQLYMAAGDEAQRRVWLQHKIDIHRAMGRAASERAIVLAADAQSVFADDAKARLCCRYAHAPAAEQPQAQAASAEAGCESLRIAGGLWSRRARRCVYV